MINVNKLHKELQTAGIKLSGCNSDGIVWDLDNKEIQNRDNVRIIIEAHDPTPEIDDIRQEEYSKVGVNTSVMIFALWKKVMQSDGADADALQLLIDEVNLSIGQ